jgi:hypothetical protein
MVAKKCGIIKENDSLDNLTLQQYVDMYKQPLIDQSMEVILKLSEVAVDKEKKKYWGCGMRPIKSSPNKAPPPRIGFGLRHYCQYVLRICFVGDDFI